MSTTPDVSDAGSDAESQVERVLGEREWPFTLKLHAPVDFGKQTIDALVFQKGKFGTLKGIAIDRTPNADDLMMIASRLCGQPLKVIEGVDPEDAAEVMAIALNFFSRCQGVGRRP